MNLNKIPLDSERRSAGHLSVVALNLAPHQELHPDLEHRVRILEALDARGYLEDALVIFTSDNGPWLSYGDHGGSAGPLREGKGTMFEGGVRVPCIMRWPGKIPAGTATNEFAATIDVLPTIAKLVGAKLPGDRIIDGRDIWPIMSGQPGAKSPHEAFFYYRLNELQAVRSGPWKLRLPIKWADDDPYRKVACPEAKANTSTTSAGRATARLMAMDSLTKGRGAYRP